MNESSLMPIIINSILAFFGGCARAAGDIGKEKFSAAGFVTGSLIAAFCGVVTFFLCMNYAVNPWLTAALTALAGYVGTPVLDLFASVVKGRLGNIAGASPGAAEAQEETKPLDESKDDII
jgi:CDP-diglyceride synthetase